MTWYSFKFKVSSLIGIVLGILTALSKTAADLVSKHSLNDDINEYVTSWAMRFFALPFLAVAVLFLGIPNIESSFYPALAVSSLIGVVATVSLMKALKLSDVSVISPLYATSPMLLLITSPIMVNEFPSPMGLVGVMCIIAGVYVMKIKSSSSGWAGPFRAILHEPGVKYILLVVVLYSISANLDKIGTEASSPLFYSFALHVLVVSSLTPLMVWKVDDWQSSVKANAKVIAPIGMFSGLASVLYMAALTYTLVIYISAIKRAATLTTVLGGWLLLGEGEIRQRLPGAVIIVIGVIIISLSLG